MSPDGQQERRVERNIEERLLPRSQSVARDRNILFERLSLAEARFSARSACSTLPASSAKRLLARTSSLLFLR